MTTTPRRLLFLLFAFSFVFVCSALSFWIGFVKEEGITVSGKDIEGKIIGEIMAQMIESHIGIPVKREFYFDGTFITFHALNTGRADLYVEYTGTAFSAILKRGGEQKSSEEIFQILKEEFLKKYDLVWLDPVGFENIYALMMEKECAKRYGIETLSDLSLAAQNTPALRFAFDQEFFARDEMKVIKEKYRIDFSNLKLMDHVLLYVALKREGCDVINGYTTDGLCRGLKILVDDKNHLPLYAAVPLVRRKVLEKYPKLRGVLGKLTGIISKEEMQEMNYAVEKKGKTFYDVAQGFMKRHALFAP